MTSTHTSPVAAFVAAADGAFRVQVRNLNARPNGQPDPQSWIVELTRTFEPGNSAEYVKTEGAAFALLRDVPRSYPGSTWGSTSDGVGGHAALASGNFHLCVSGVSATFAKALRKALG